MECYIGVTFGRKKSSRVGCICSTFVPEVNDPLNYSIIKKNHHKTVYFFVLQIQTFLVILKC